MRTRLAEPDWYAGECLGGVRVQPAEVAPAPWLVPGDLFYLHNVRGAGQFPMSVYTSPIPTYTFTLLGPNPNPNFAVDFDNTATTLWGINNTTRGLGTYNLTTGAFTQTVVTTGIPAAETISGLKFDPTSTTVYVNMTLNLFTLNTATGVATLVGPFTHAAPAVIDIAISNTGQMYGEDLNDNFYSINKATGATTLIGAMGVNINFAQGMDFDNSDNSLYQFAYIGGGVNDLPRINTTTGVSTLILNGAVGAEQEGSVKVAAVPAVSVAPAANSVDAAGNGVFQPNETVVMAPTWRNNATAPVTLAGALSAFTGPVGPTYAIVDGTASYGPIAAASTASCGANCYSLSVTSATRPVTHWDTTVLETVNPSATTKTWTLHIGDSFTDVPASNGFYKFIETILHKNVTGGCTATTYCPTAPASREQMAVFVLRTLDPALSPPACVAGSERFTDVPATSGFCKWIEELVRRGVVTGCGPNTYCPTAAVTREQMSVFLAVTFGLVLYGL